MSLIHGGFQDLPSELIRQILNFLQNKDSLYSTTTSCKRLWQTFKEYESSICYNVALNFCGRPEYLHEALAVIEAGRVPREEWTELEMRRFMDKYTSFDQDFFYPRKWSEKILRSVEALYKCVEYFAINFAVDAISKKSDTLETTITEAEKRRFIRAFCRLQIYTNIFGSEKKKPVQPIAQSSEFFGQFAPWEMEQLACVYDYFMYKITAVLDIKAKISEPWRKWIDVIGLGYVGLDCDVARSQYQLTRGVEKLHDILSASEETIRSETFLTSEEDIGSTSGFLSAAFSYRALNNNLDDDFYWLCDLTEEQEEKVLTRPVAQDDRNSGPEDIWRWAHEDQAQQDFVHGAGQAVLRRWAYVMWDRNRLDAWRVFDDGPWQPQYLLGEDEQLYRDIESHEWFRVQDEKVRHRRRCGYPCSYSDWN